MERESASALEVADELTTTKKWGWLRMWLGGDITSCYLLEKRCDQFSGCKSATPHCPPLTVVTSVKRRPLEVRIMEHKYKLAQGILEESNMTNMHTRWATEYVGKKRRSCRLSQTPPTGNTRNPPTCLWQLIRSVNPAWTSLPSGFPLLQQKSENYNSVQCRLCRKVVFLCCYYTEFISLVVASILIIFGFDRLWPLNYAWS
jgi:hypothetical protein